MWLFSMELQMIAPAVNAHNNSQPLLMILHVPGTVTCFAHIISLPITTTLSENYIIYYTSFTVKETDA